MALESTVTGYINSTQTIDGDELGRELILLIAGHGEKIKLDYNQAVALRDFLNEAIPSFEQQKDVATVAQVTSMNIITA